MLQSTKTRPLIHQNEFGRLFLSGLKVSGGHIDHKEALLMEEFSREFTHNLGFLTANVRTKPKMNFISVSDFMFQSNIFKGRGTFNSSYYETKSY